MTLLRIFIGIRRTLEAQARMDESFARVRTVAGGGRQKAVEAVEDAYRAEVELAQTMPWAPMTIEVIAEVAQQQLASGLPVEELGAALDKFRARATVWRKLSLAGIG